MFMKCFLQFSAFLILMLSAAMADDGTKPSKAAKPDKEEPAMIGKVSLVDANSITLQRGKDGSDSRTFRITPETKAKEGGKPGSVDKIVVNSQCRVYADDSGEVATLIIYNPPKHE